MVIQNWADFPVTWSGVRKRWAEMSAGRRTAAISGMAVVALVVVF